MKKILSVLFCIALVAAACGDDGDDDDAASQNGDGAPSTTEADVGEPVQGGTLTMGMCAFSIGLDPVIESGTGVAGGIELAALYDTLMRYNPDTAEFEPRVAESLTPNADFTKWTLKLRPGVKFTDGTAYDSAAVVTNLK